MDLKDIFFCLFDLDYIFEQYDISIKFTIDVIKNWKQLLNYRKSFLMVLDARLFYQSVRCIIFFQQFTYAILWLFYFTISIFWIKIIFTINYNNNRDFFSIITLETHIAEQKRKRKTLQLCIFITDGINTNFSLNIS